MYEELKTLLVETAKAGQLIYYEDLAPMFHLNYERDHDRAEIGRILDSVSREEVAARRPMLSAVVVLKGDEEKMPGGGFFTLARELRRFKGGDKKLYWSMEVKDLYAYWQAQPNV